MDKCKEGKTCKVVAEIGCSHIGSVDRAKELIRLAILCGADYVKFQKRNPIESVSKHLQDQPHPNAQFSYGNTYLEHRLALELNADQHQELKNYCETNNVGYAVSVWDMTSAREMVALSPKYIKLPSACNLNKTLLQYLVKEYLGDIHISTGMIALEERAQFYTMLKEAQCESRIVLYHCTSEYPCPFERLYLHDIERLKWAPAREVGFSNHGYGIAADIAAYTLGVTWIERHFIDDRTFPHTDASASLEPDGLRRLCRDLKAVQKSMALKQELSKEELEARKKLRND